MGVTRKAFYICLIAVALYFCNQWMDGCTCDPKHRIDGKVVIVTGANSGLGKATTEDLALRGGKIYMACRSIDKGSKAAEEILSTHPGIKNSQLVVLKLDLGSSKSIKAFVDEFSKHEKVLNILVNNAGIGLNPAGTKTEDGIETNIGVNCFGPFRLTTLLADRLIAGAPSRVVTISADTEYMAPETFQLDDLNNEKGTLSWIQVEYHSRLCAESYTTEFGRRLKDAGVTTYSLHPGIVFTDGGTRKLIGNEFITDMLVKITPYFMKSAVEGAQTQICCAVDPALSQESGKFYTNCEKVETHPIIADVDIARKLWDAMMRAFSLENSDMHEKLRI